MEPAVLVDGFSGGLWIFEITLHDVVAANDNFTGLTNINRLVVVVDAADFHVGDGTAGRRCNGFGAVALAAHGRKATAFGEAVSGENGFKAECVFHLMDHFYRYRCGTGRRTTQAANVVAIQVFKGQK